MRGGASAPGGQVPGADTALGIFHPGPAAGSREPTNESPCFRGPKTSVVHSLSHRARARILKSNLKTRTDVKAGTAERSVSGVLRA